MTTLHDFSAATLDGRPKSLADYRGKVVLVVNTASECGFTPQYAGLQALHAKYRDRGLEVLGFPCNQFGAQEPGDAAQIGAFCEKNYGVAFQMFEKVEVKGAQAHPLYKWLTSTAPGILGTEAIKWNFTKFLVGRDGNVVKRYAPQDKPQDMAADIERTLAQPLNPAPFGEITHVIQLAVAPVFLLAGIGTVLMVLTNRLGRSVDRRRVLAHILSKVDHGLEKDTAISATGELETIERRIRLIYVAISLDVTAALFICVLVALAFVDALVVFDLSRLIAALFILAMLALIGALSVFLREIFLAVNAPRSTIR